MLQRKLGAQGLQVSNIGLGCMGMSDFYGDSEEANNLAVLCHALDIGLTFWDTADAYGPYANERLLGRFFAQQPKAREQVQLTSKFGIVRNEKGEFLGVNGRPEYVKAACDASLKRLGVEYLDLYYQHRIDTQVPIEETVGAMADLVQEGKVKYLGLSEASAETIRRAHAVHPISAVQTEYSLWSREIEDHILPTCQALNIGLVPYSPLGRGFLTGAIRSRADLQPHDARLLLPRFSEAHFAKNLALVEQIQCLAQAKACTPAQLALAWLLAQYSQIVPIPGTRSAMRLRENAAAHTVCLKQNELEQLNNAFDITSIQGDRYPAAYHSNLLADTPPLAKANNA